MPWILDTSQTFEVSLLTSFLTEFLLFFLTEKWGSFFYICVIQKHQGLYFHHSAGGNGNKILTDRNLAYVLHLHTSGKIFLLLESRLQLTSMSPVFSLRCGLLQAISVTVQESRWEVMFPLFAETKESGTMFSACLVSVFTRALNIFCMETLIFKAGIHYEAQLSGL